MIWCSKKEILFGLLTRKGKRSIDGSPFWSLQVTARSEEGMDLQLQGSK